MISGRAIFSGRLQTKLIKKSRVSRIAKWRRRLSNALYAMQGAPVMYSQLSVRHYIAAENKWIDYGVVCCKVVTDAFVDFMVDQLQTETSIWGDFKYHASGTGVGAEDAGDTALGAEVETPRPGSGSQTEGASSNIYKSVETITYTGTHAITEHGLFNAATGVTLMDRSKFAAINVENTDQIQFTYELTCTAGG